MRSLARILLCSVCLLSLVVPAVCADDDAPSRRNKGKAEEKQPQGSLGKEMAALGEAAGLLAQVKDEAGATQTAEKLCKKFASMPPLLTGTASELELLSKAQNKVSDQMERLMSTPYFVSSGLQEAWTLMTDHFSRRSAQRRRRK